MVSKLSVIAKTKPDHSRIVATLLAEATVLPSGLNATLRTSSRCPVNGCPSWVWVATSHSLTALSAVA